MGQSVKEREAEEDPNEALMSSSSDDTKKSRGCWGRWWERFYHQELKGWKPRPTAYISIVTFAVMAVAMLGLGGLFLYMALAQVQVHKRYDDQGVFTVLTNEQRSELLRKNGTVTTTIKIYIDEDMKAPVYMYYKLDDFYQNHKKYVKSINYDQLHGKSVGKGSLGDCDTKKTIDQSKLNETEKAAVVNNGIINPCGLGPWSFFNDSFSDLIIFSKGQQPPYDSVPVDSTDLVWDSDRDELYGNYSSENFNIFPGLRGGSDLEVRVAQSEHFMAWLKFSSEPDAVKYWGKISRDLNKGETIKLTVTNQFNTYDFDGKKWVLLSTSGALGGRNPTFGIIWLGAGILWTVATIVYTAVAMRTGHLNRRSKQERIAWLESRLSWNRPKSSPLRDILSRDLSLPADRGGPGQMARLPDPAPANGPLTVLPSRVRTSQSASAPQAEAPARHTVQVQAPAGLQSSLDQHRDMNPAPAPLPPAGKVGQSTASLDSCRLPQPYLPGMQSPEQSFMRASSFGTNRLEAETGSGASKVHGDGNPVDEAASAQSRAWVGSSGQQSSEAGVLDGSVSSGIGRGTSLNGWIVKNGR